MRTGNTEGDTEARAGFSHYDKRTFAVRISDRDRDRDWLVRGVAHLEHCDDLGAVLRISLDDDIGSPSIIVSEMDFSGSIVPGGKYGCDYYLFLGHRHAQVA